MQAGPRIFNFRSEDCPSPGPGQSDMSVSIGSQGPARPFTPAGDSSSARPAPVPRGSLQARAAAVAAPPPPSPRCMRSQMAVARNIGPAGRLGPLERGRCPRPDDGARMPEPAAAPDAPPWIGVDGARSRGSGPILPIACGGGFEDCRNRRRPCRANAPRQGACGCLPMRIFPAAVKRARLQRPWLDAQLRRGGGAGEWAGAAGATAGCRRPGRLRPGRPRGRPRPDPFQRCPQA